MKTESFDAFCRSCLDALKAQRIRHIVVGGLAATIVGEPRLTADLDVVIFADEPAIRRLVTYATQHGFVADIEAELEAVRQGGSLRLDRGRFHFDLIVRSLFIEDLAYEHARAHKLFGRSVRCPSPEDLAVLKIVAGRPRDLLDVEGIVRRHGAKLDRKYIAATLERVCELAEDHAILDRWRQLTKAK